MSIQRILLILCIAAAMLYAYGLRTVEGFLAPVAPVQGMLPEAVQASMIPRDSASATTTNPQLAKPDYRDWVAARDSFHYFMDIYTPHAAFVSGKEADVAVMLLEAPRYIAQIKQYIQNPEAIPSRDILDRGFEAQALANAMRRVGAADPYLFGERPGCISHRDDNLMA